MKRNKEGRRAPTVGILSRMNGARPLMLKAVGWILAVPALCAAVLVAGAVPLYLLLPDKVAAPAPAAPTEKALRQAERGAVAPAVAHPPLAASLALKHQPIISDTPEGAPSSDAAPPTEDVGEDVATAPSEPAYLDVRPTPRPARVAALRPKPTDARSGMSAALPKIEGSDRVSRAVALRAGPHGRQLGVLPQGTQVAVLHCDGWCEIRSAEGDGWIHSSFLTGRTQADDGGSPRVAERSRRGAGDNSRREVRREERPAGNDWRHDDPAWLLPDDPMAYADEDPGGVFYDAFDPDR